MASVFPKEHANTCQWYLWGYALTFGSGSGETTWTWYGGHTQATVLYRVMVRPVGAAGPKIPELLFAFYQGMFASFTPTLICGGVIKRFKMGRFLIFISLWSLLVYYPVARWAWSPGGFSSQHGIMDFAGGTVVHITSGTAAGAVVLFHAIEKYGMGIFKAAWNVARQLEKGTELDAMELRARSQARSQSRATASSQNSIVPRAEVAEPEQASKRSGNQVLTRDAPHSINNLVLGTMLLWIGWLGFNGGSALGGNMRAVSACVSTHVAASIGGSVMLLLFWAAEGAARRFGEGSRGAKASVVHFCDGAVVGLVAVTPAAGYV